MRLFIITLTFLLLVLNASAWERVTTEVNIESNADQNKVVIYNLWKSFVEAHNDSTSNFPQWNNADKLRWKQPDLISSEGYINADIYRYLNKVLEITPQSDAYVIRSMFYTPYTDYSDVFVLALVNHIAKKDDSGEFKLYNWQDYYSRDWQRKSVGSIDYCYYPGYSFNEDKAQEANALIDLFRTKLKAEIPQHITYFIARNLDDEYRLKGYDYVVGMGDQMGNTGGSIDRRNKIIYGDVAHGEIYHHELARLLRLSYPDMHFLLNQGLAEYVNSTQMQFGLPVRQHFARMKDWLDANPQEDISNLDSPFYSMDNQTAPAYQVGMVVCNELYKNGGYEALVRAMKAGEDDAVFYAFLKKEIGIGQQDFNKWMRSKIAKYSTEDITPLK
jgi:hypothetical protein